MGRESKEISVASYAMFQEGGTFVYRDDAQVVDTFADARDRDILNLAEEMEHNLEADKLCLIEKETIL